MDEDCDGIDLVTRVYEPGLFSFTIFPNPASEFLYFSTDLPEEITVELFDVTGHLWYKQTGTEPMDVSVFSSGIYIIKAASMPGRSAYAIKLALVK